MIAKKFIKSTVISVRNSSVYNSTIWKLNRDQIRKYSIYPDRVNCIEMAKVASSQQLASFTISIKIARSGRNSSIGLYRSSIGFGPDPYMSTFPDSAGGSRIFTQIFKTSRIHTIYRWENSVSLDLKMQQVIPIF